MRWGFIGLAAVGAIAAAVAIIFIPNMTGAPVEVAPATRGPAIEAVYATGTVEPVAAARITSKVTARIATIMVEEEAVVKAGDVLAKLDSTDIDAKVRELEAKAAQAQSDAQRAARLFGAGTGTAVQRDQQRTNANAVTAQLEALRAQLAEYTILAPISGHVLRKDAEVGEVADPTRKLFVIGDRDALRITADVDERDIPRLKLGQRTLIKADAFPGKVMEGVVSEMTPQGDPVARSYRVRIKLPADTILKIGMTTELNIIIREDAKALLVPAAAISAGNLFVVEDGIARKRQIELGAQGADSVEIRSGLKDGDTVVVRPSPGLKDGTKVRTQPMAKPDSKARP